MLFNILMILLCEHTTKSDMKKKTRKRRVIQNVGKYECIYIAEMQLQNNPLEHFYTSPMILYAN